MNTRFKIGDIVVDDYRCPGKVLEIVEIRENSTLPIRAQEVDFNRVWNYTLDGAATVGGLPVLRLKDEFPRDCDILDELEYLSGKISRTQKKLDQSIRELSSTVVTCTLVIVITIVFFQVVSYFR